MFRVIFSLVNLGVFCLLNSVSAENVAGGGLCSLDADCAGNLDCVRVGLFQKRCAPVSCVKGAAQALLDANFVPDEYIEKIRGRTGLRSERDFLTLDADQNELLSQAIRANPPNMTVFNSNLTACLNPGRRLGSLDRASDSSTWYGLQWSAAALFAYFGKSTWHTYDTVIDGERRAQLVSNCVGFILGADVGLDVLFQVYSDSSGRRLEDLEDLERVSQNQTSSRQNSGETQFIPIFTAGPFGIQVGWNVDDGPDSGTITEITLGPSFGLHLLGYSHCFNDLDLDA